MWREHWDEEENESMAGRNSVIYLLENRNQSSAKSTANHNIASSLCVILSLFSSLSLFPSYWEYNVYPWTTQSIASTCIYFPHFDVIYLPHKQFNNGKANDTDFSQSIVSNKANYDNIQ